MSKNILQECLSALNTLFSPSDDHSLKAKADEWLIAFQRKSEAWAVCDQILSREGLADQNYYFAANTLRSKLLFDFGELPEKARLSFRDALLKHMRRFKDGPQVVRARLALCVATLAVHLAGTEWKDPLADLTASFAKPDTALAYINILKEVPEEASNKRLLVTRERRIACQKLFSNFSMTALDILLAYLNSTGKNRDLQKKVLDCFLSWIRQGIPPDTLAKHALFINTFHSLSVPELFGTACEVICECMRQSDEVDKFPDFVKVMVGRVLQLVPLFEKYMKENREEECQRLCAVFCELGESYIRFILQLSPQAQASLDAIVKATGHPNKDISSHTFNFWYILTEEHNRMKEDKQPEFKQKFGIYFSRVVDHLRMIVKYPLEYTRWDAETKEKSKRYRYFSSETLLDCATIIGSDQCLRQIFKALQDETRLFSKNPDAWHGVEACLYCLRSIARKVNPDEENFIPKIMDLLPKFAVNPHLRYTSTLIVGRYSEWLKCHPKYLNGLLSFVVQGLGDKDNAVANSAALAFKFVCESCASYLAQLFVDNVFHVYNKSKSLTSPNQLLIIEGVSNVVSALPPTKIQEYLMKLMHPVAKDLHAALQVAPSSDKKEAADEQVLICLDRIGEALKTINNTSKDETPAVLSKATVHLLENIWKLFELTLSRYKSDPHKMERLSRCYKYSIRTAKSHFDPLLPEFIKLITAFYQQAPHSSVLYLVSICVDEFGSYPKYHHTLTSLFHEFATRTFLVLKDTASVNDNPDFVEDFFEMVHRYLKKCPQIIFGSTLLNQVFMCGLFGLQMHHREALRSLMNFYEFLIWLAIDHPRENTRRNGAPKEAHVKGVQALFKSYGQQLADGLIQAVAGGVPHSRVQFIIPVLLNIMHFVGKPSQQLFGTAIAKVKTVDPPVKQEFLKGLFSAKDSKSAKEAIYGLANESRRKDH